MHTTASPSEDITLDSYQGWSLTRHEAAGAGDLPDLLFLHGMSAGGWVWTERWLGHFTEAGHRCWTMSLPGRPVGATMATDPGVLDRVLSQAMQGGDAGAALDALAAALPGASLFDGPGLDTLTGALAEALAAIGRPTVVVGHSLGGAVAQNLLRRGGRPAATVLLCSAPPYGLWRASMEMATTNLALWKAMFDLSFFGVAATDPRVIRDNMFPNGISEAEFRTVLSRLTDEALAATARTSGFPPFAPLPGPRSDLLVIGAGKDRFVPPLDVHLTGLYYGSRPRIVAGAGHMPMYEPAFLSETAGHILDWLPGIAAGD
ncbi:alpha/beta fold hydrolase [Tropicimonas sediminicola]|uniref:Lysophospholipase, alpha-beta hydrolase superfamily n=1 Tax=Tropicimonas sediminicola TaxID=1031541 RepID=A0A239KYG0_9RHOB|nr:alpha/beta fold hydrolase [Tropicimonas sediminicola]SNT22294.1 Lysophospholipase, alpha-beta hydrolase superfamily [Tropicimonas sediminicola]